MFLHKSPQNPRSPTESEHSADYAGTATGFLGCKPWTNHWLPLVAVEPSVEGLAAVSGAEAAGSAGALALVAGGVAGALVATLFVSVAAPAGALVPALSEPALQPASASAEARHSIASSTFSSALFFHNFICVLLSLGLYDAKRHLLRRFLRRNRHNLKQTRCQRRISGIEASDH